MQLRSNSYAYRYNKVSMKADDAVRKILLSKGYYKKAIEKHTVFINYSVQKHQKPVKVNFSP